MALNKNDREEIEKAAKEAREKRELEIKFSQSGGSVYVNGTKYTDSYYAKKKINGDDNK
jgi:hypothetical protein